MNNTELYQLVLENPQAETAEIIAKMHSDAKFKQFVLKQRLQQQQLEQALRISPPAELQAQLLKLPQQTKTTHGWLSNLAIAASIAFLALSSTILYNQFSQQDLANHILAHVHFEQERLDRHLVNQPLAEVNAKLASFNMSLEDWPEQILYAQYCNFKGIRSLHLAVKTASGYATVFIMPKEAKLKFTSHFSDLDYQGLALTMQAANLVIVSQQAEDLKVLPGKLLANLRTNA
ncbi:DUF3379 family protein [Rheinheimera sp. WS51]|uniref:DUF3379 family protein n=1 Tax=Rheinheimera sp. WS51 TaxID=3425886 RepID=UPI003D90C88E